MKRKARILALSVSAALFLGTIAEANDCGTCWKRNARPFGSDYWICQSSLSSETWCDVPEDGSWCVDGSGGCVGW